MVAAARSVLLKLASILEDERDKIVFVGGTACALLFPQETDPHEGTIDVDIALNTVDLADYDEDTLKERLATENFQQDALKEGEKPRPIKKFRWFLSVYVDGEPEAVEVAVDFLTAEYEGGNRLSTAPEVQELFPSRLRGLDLAFLDPRLVSLSGLLPDGKPYQTQVKVCSPASLLAMKGIAITDRKEGKDKDAFDIDYILRCYEGDPDALARVLRTDLYRLDGLVQEGLQGIAQAFRSSDALGPTSIATADRYPDPEERAIVQQGTYQRAQRLLRELGIYARSDP